jgi:hypothetical protein
VSEKIGSDFETLRHLHDRQFDELQYRRARQYEIFTGTLLILLRSDQVSRRSEARSANRCRPELPSTGSC